MVNYMTIIDKTTKKALISAQKDEITSYYIYKKLASIIKDPHNSEILLRIAKAEKEHFKFLKELTRKEISANKWKVWLYIFILRFFGLTFGIRLMERGEESAQVLYSKLTQIIPGINKILQDEEKHEEQLINMLNEEMLDYIGSIVLGLSDALVELTGALAGFTLALENSQLIAVIGFITGFSATLSMGASEYLSSSEEDLEQKSPIKAALYTSIAYFFTVVILIIPFFLISQPLIALSFTIVFAVSIIFTFTFYISVAKSISFKKRFIRITSISLGVAFISLIIGILVKIIFNIDI